MVNVDFLFTKALEDVARGVAVVAHREVAGVVVVKVEAEEEEAAPEKKSLRLKN